MSDPIIKVKSETKITPVTSDSVISPNPLSIPGKLVEKATGTPLSNAQITLSYTSEGQDQTLSSRTNQTGHGLFSIESLTEYANKTLEYAISYKGTEYYLPSEAESQIFIQSIFSETNPENPSGSYDDNTQNIVAPFYTSPFFLGGVPLAITAIGFVFLLIRRRKKKETQKKPEPPQEPLPNNKALVKSETDTFELEIIFPQITSPFPDKWGVNENLTVKVLLRKNNEPHRKETVKLTVDDQKENNLVTNEKGTAATKLKFKEKRVYKIKAEYKDNSSAAKCAVNRIITIIDYTEEIVEIFNSLFLHFKLTLAQLNKTTTPREFQEIIIKNFSQVNKKSLDKLVSLFEIAEYSLYKLHREEYEKMFLSSRAVQTSIEKPTAQE